MKILNSSEHLPYGVENRKEKNKMEKCARNIHGTKMLF